MFGKSGGSLGSATYLKASAEGWRTIRITGQLVGAETGHHVWADKLDGDLADIFDLQDRVTELVVGAIEPRLKFAEVARSSTKRTDNLSASTYTFAPFLTGMRSLKLERKAIKSPRQRSTSTQRSPPQRRWRPTAMACRYRTGMNQMLPRKPLLARSAVEDGWDDPEALRIAGHVLGGITRDYLDAVAALDRALSLNLNSAAAWASSGWGEIVRGEPDTGLRPLRASEAARSTRSRDVLRL